MSCIRNNAFEYAMTHTKIRNSQSTIVPSGRIYIAKLFWSRTGSLQCKAADCSIIWVIKKICGKYRACCHMNCSYYIKCQSSLTSQEGMSRFQLAESDGNEEGGASCSKACFNARTSFFGEVKDDDPDM